MGIRKRFIPLVTSGLLQTLDGLRKRRVTGPSNPGNEESAGKPQIVDLGPTKHWTTTVITTDEVSVECRCGWIRMTEIGAGGMGLPDRVGVAVRLGRQHISDMIPEP